MVLALQRFFLQAESSDLSLLQMPETIRLSGLRYIVSAEYLSEMESQGITVPDSLEGAILKRKVEFAAGRFCARSALQQLGYWSDALLVRGTDRAPTWPAGYLGSISHCNGLAIAAAAKTSCWSGVGIDIEHPLDKEAAQPIVAQLATNAEMRIGTEKGLTLEQWATLIFSAKESLFKALYPKVGRYFDFLDTAVCQLRAEEACIVIQLLTTLSPQYVEGAEYCVRYTYFDDCVVTLCQLPIQAAPRLHSA